MLVNVQITPIQFKILIAMADLFIDRKNEENNNKKVNINAYSIHKKSGVSYNTVKVSLLKLKELK